LTTAPRLDIKKFRPRQRDNLVSKKSRFCVVLVDKLKRDFLFITFDEGESMAQIKLAEALLRRKELQGKVDQLKQIKDKDLFDVRARRQAVAEGIDDIVAQVPKLTASQVTAEFDFYARQLRLVDAVIQQANWTTEIAVQDSVLADYKAA